MESQRSSRNYADYVVFTAKAPANIVLAIVYVGVAAAFFGFGHPVWAGLFLPGAS
jgi:hypothetical protein